VADTPDFIASSTWLLPKRDDPICAGCTNFDLEEPPSAIGDAHELLYAPCGAGAETLVRLGGTNGARGAAAALMAASATAVPITMPVPV
jgi:hypothetical protein